MLRLNHANLPVTEPGPLRDFLVRHFGFETLLTRGDDAFVVLKGEGDFILNVMRAKPSDHGFPANFHIGFFLASPEEVRAKHDELHAENANPGDVQSLTRGGFSSLTFYCHAPSGILVEVGCELP
ncbi:MAG: VOC family protein [Gemmatimonadaceae bacterium]